MSAPAIYFFKKDEAHGWLSNWSEHGFEADGLRFPTAEHSMMYHKALLMGDGATAELILATPSPHAAKKLGRRVKPWDEALWVRERFGIMVRACRAKARAHPELKQKLLDTGDAVLAEASPFDRVWGIGIGAAKAREGAPWRGQNLLGKAWMHVREQNV